MIADLLMKGMGIVLMILCAYWVIAMIWLFGSFVLEALGYEVTIEKRRD